VIRKPVPDSLLPKITMFYIFLYMCLYHLSFCVLLQSYSRKKLA